MNRLIWEGRTYAWRLDMEKALARAEEINHGSITFIKGEGPNGEKGELPIHPLGFGDVVLARKDVPTSYHLSVTLDDAVQGITHVTRGQDLFPHSIHRILQICWACPNRVIAIMV